MRILIIIILFFPLLSSGQTDRPHIWGWRTITSAGFLAGEKGTKETFQLSGGVTKDRFFVGIGAAYDPYELRSIPVFTHLRIHFAKNNALFVYGAPGYTLPGHVKKTDEAFKTKDRMKGGLYLEGGVGYRVPLQGIHHISFSVGYSQKNLEQTKVYSYPCGVTPCYSIPSNTYVYDYKFGRVIVKLSWEWGK